MGIQTFILNKNKHIRSDHKYMQHRSWLGVNKDTITGTLYSIFVMQFKIIVRVWNTFHNMQASFCTQQIER